MKLKKIFQLIYYLGVAFLVLTVLLFIGSKLPIPGNYKLMSVMSGSMTPAIKTGSIVVIKPSESYKIGDIITFAKGNGVSTTHRIVETEVIGGATFFTTQGDANSSPDPQKVKKQEILGKVLFSLPYFGYFVDFLKKPTGFLIAILLPALIIIIDELYKIWQQLKKNSSRNLAKQKRTFHSYLHFWF